MTRCLLLAILFILLAVLLCTCAALLGAGLWLTIDSSSTTSDPVVGPPTPTVDLPPLTPPDQTAWETLARLDAAVVPIHDPTALYTILAPEAAPNGSSRTATAYRVGDRRSFRMSNHTADAELIHVTEHTYTWLVDGVQTDRTALVAAAEHFENHIYPTVRHYFGYEWSPGIDGDPHLSMLHYSDRGDDAAGYFSTEDELPNWVDRSSNEMEMFYINIGDMDPGDDYYFAVLAHEFEHMIHWNNDRNEEDWLDEGLAELACRLAGYDPGNSDESFYRNPDTQLTDWPYDEDTTVHYGAGYRFALYLLERFGDDLIWDLVHHPANGMASLDIVLDAHDAAVSADEVFADWVVVNALDAGDYAYRQEDWDERLGLEEVYTEYPVTVETNVRPYGTDYYSLNGQGTLAIRFWGAPQARLLPVDPHSGQTVWWSNVGNRSDARLTRRFDLSGLASATLRFWTWYDLENGYDYVYLSASRDGQNWEVLRTSSTRSGGDYGPAYNGSSDGWVEEVVDLSAYAGGALWIRFDQVTDSSINGAGFLLDDVSIPELGLADACEDDGDWQAEGFVRASALIPQNWLVQLIELSDNGELSQIRRMSLDDAQSGELELALGGDTQQALLVVSALTRYTTEPGTYTYELIDR